VLFVIDCAADVECCGLQVLNPTTGEVLATSGAASVAQANRAVEAAAEAFKTWRHTTEAERAKWLREFAWSTHRAVPVSRLSADSPRHG
jgi:acyl-CoA reductase-like NAD-dependent aldehyde dehydrogenase